MQTLTVTDNNSNTGSCNATVTVQDNTAPTAGCQNATVQLDANGSGSLSAVLINNGSDDACGIGALAVSPASFGCGDIGANSVVLSVFDVAGNTATCNATATVQENVPPLSLCQDVAISLNAGGSVSITTADINNGSSDACGPPSLALSQSTFNCTETGANTVVLTSTDGASNTSACTATVTVNDVIDPVATCPSDVVTNNDASTCGATVNWTVSTSDNCSGESLFQSAGLASASFYPGGVTSNDFIVTDASGNTGTCGFTVTVNDSELPVVTCPGDINVNNDLNQCSAIITFVVTKSDNCPNSSLLQISGSSSGSAFDVGSVVNSYVVTDISENSATCSFTIVVADAQFPVFTSFPLDKTESTRVDVCGQNVSFSTPLASDNCFGVIVSQVDGSGLSSGSLFPEGATELVFHAIDTSGNVTPDTLTITVVDNSAPVITCPADQTANATTCGANVTYTAVTAVDNCTGTTITRVTGQASGSFYGLGGTLHTYSARDGNSNLDFCSFTITVEDNTAPDINCFSSMTVNTDVNTCISVQSWSVSTSDNCPGEVLTQTAGLPSGSSYPVGTTTNSFMVTDTAGNTNTCSANIAVQENEDPVWTAFPADLNFNSTSSGCGGNFTFLVTPAGTDNCPGFTITQTSGIESGGFFPHFLIQYIQ